MFGLGMGEIMVILFVALIFIGPKKLPELAKGLGKGIREFQNAAKGLTDSIKTPTANENSSYAAQKPAAPVIAKEEEVTIKLDQIDPDMVVKEKATSETKES